MIGNITYFQIFGKPLIMWVGIGTFISLVITLGIVKFHKQLGVKNHLKWHKRWGILTFIFAIIHALLGLLAF